MARTLSKGINVVRAVTQIRSWRVLEYHQDSNGSHVLVETSQDRERLYGVFWLHARHVGASVCLFVNPNPTSADDQLLLGSRTLKEDVGYQIAAAYAEGGGDHFEKLVALEPTLLAVGLLDPAFA
jgi:hypothetical protein